MDLARSDLCDRGCDISGNEVPRQLLACPAISRTAIESWQLQRELVSSPAYIPLRLTLVLTHILNSKANHPGVGASASKIFISFLRFGLVGYAVGLRQLASSFCLRRGQQC